MKFIPVFFTVFLPTIVMADDLYTNDIIGGCGDAYYYKAILEPISYTCSNGQYLPAGAVSCEVCPNTHTCSGGTYAFNANQTQGLSGGDILVTNAIGSCSAQFNQSYSAIFEPISYTCLPGYYLPAGNDWTTDDQGCTKCQSDNYCPGGTYTFNETTAQGITQCPSAHPFAPAGMWAATQCGRILHIGNEIIYLHQSPANPTEHRLYVRVNDAVYSVNLTQKQDAPDDIKMSAGANRSLHIMFNDIEYLAHDDSTENQ